MTLCRFPDSEIDGSTPVNGSPLAGKSLSFHTFFKVPVNRTGHLRSRGVFREQRSYLGVNPFHEVRPLRRKENSSQELSGS
jgi:hypothetical protein